LTVIASPPEELQKVVPPEITRGVRVLRDNHIKAGD
jgi:hypothetical protein